MNLNDYAELQTFAVFTVIGSAMTLFHDLSVNLQITHRFVNYHFGTRGQMRGGNRDWI